MLPRTIFPVASCTTTSLPVAHSRIVEEDFADSLNEEGQLSLRRIADAARRAAKLVDDLLAYSRLEHQEVAREPVDLVAHPGAPDLDPSVILVDALVRRAGVGRVGVDDRAVVARCA